MKTLKLIIAIALTALIGCGKKTTSSPEHSWRDSGSKETGTSGPSVRIIALSPSLDDSGKAAAKSQVQSELGWICKNAPVGAETQLWDALAAKPIATFRAVQGAVRVRLRENARAELAMRAYFAKVPTERDDGRVHLPRFAQAISQKHFPKGTAVVVFGNPLFISSGKDAAYNMDFGYVPSDGVLGEPARMNLFSTRGRLKALDGQIWFFAANGEFFLDDSHRIGVERFWAMWLKTQGATLVHFGASFPAAIVAMREGQTEPLSADTPDLSAKPGMIKVVRSDGPEVKIEPTTPPRRDDPSKPIREETETSVRRESRDGDISRTAPKANLEFDKFGNPKDADLIGAKDARGQKLLWITTGKDENLEQSPLLDSLRSKGIIVTTLSAPLPPPSEFRRILASTDQAWIFACGEKPGMTAAHAEAVAEAWRSGLDVALLGDNDPLFHDVNSVLDRIAKGSRLAGNWKAQQVIGPRLGAKGSGFDASSSIFSGVLKFWEGITVATITCSSGLEPICWHTGGRPLIAIREGRGKEGRVVVHGGFTQFFRDRFESAGTERLGINIAGWLAGITRSE